MNQLQILFTDGEYAEPKRILHGLKLEHVGKRLNNQGHSIYEELYHLVYWQEIMVWLVKNPDGERLDNGTEFPPTQAPVNEAEWQDLMKKCLGGIEEAIAFAGQNEHWDNPLGSGDTVRERLSKLAVHNAYHFGKIVALRQQLGIWPTT
jgi:hypothetical protein